ncbi:MAG: hypothetical protein F6K26_27650 [Moorea sp. SIO2I5]|nr:hypothetical protein [Moorena sp. SIO2I5]
MSCEYRIDGKREQGAEAVGHATRTEQGAVGKSLDDFLVFLKSDAAPSCGGFPHERLHQDTARLFMTYL